MPDAAPNAELLRSLGRLARGLSALFWGLPGALLVCVQTTRAERLSPPGVGPALAATGLLLYGLWQMSHFQKQERPWRNALDRTIILGLVNFFLCPFLYWYNKSPDQLFFIVAIYLFALAGVLFLFNLNLVLARLGAMLPDETLRHETKQFTALNRNLLAVLLLLAGIYLFLVQTPDLPPSLGVVAEWMDRGGLWAAVVFVLLPLAMTMALIWKTKEVILDSVFDAK